MRQACADQKQSDPALVTGRSVSPLLELFSPAHPDFAAPVVARPNTSTLWAADAVHRANNLAQLASGVGQAAKRFPSLSRGPNFQSKMAALSDAYADLSRDHGGSELIACKEVLHKIVTGLADLFGEGGEIDLCFSATDLFLSVEKRRALVLIASELVINALKYAFPDGKAGRIDVSLWKQGNEVQLAVKDDGVGLNGSEAPGVGHRLIDDMCRLLGSTIGRASWECGLWVWVKFLISPDPVKQPESAAAAIDRDGNAEFPIQVSPDDIDHMGHVNNAVYLSWVQDVVVKNWIRLASPDEVAAHLWVAVRHEITYRRPAFLDDPIRATIVLDRFQGAKAIFDTVIRRGDEIVAEARSIWCCLDAITQRPMRIARNIAQRFSAAPAPQS